MTNRRGGWVKAWLVLAFVGLCLGGTVPAFSEEQKCPESDSGLSLPTGFCATIFADKVGHARQLAVTPDGTVYVNTWSGVYYGNDTPHEGGFLVALKDTKGTGQADVNVRFGPTFAEGAHGGTGIWLYKNWLYAEINDKIVRYELKSGEAAPTGKPETILSGMPITGDHPMHPFAIDAQGNLFVSMGSATNACEVQNRMPHSPGNNPCTELDTRAGIWRYDANKSGQVFSPKERYATGLRNGEGLDFDTSGRLFVTQHGRDQLHEDWPELYTADQGFNLPAEEVVILKEGANYGWPTCYYDDGAEEACSCAGVWRRRRQEGRRLRQIRSASRCISRSLGTERSQDLQRFTIPEGLPRRRLHRLPWLMESSARAARRLQRRVPTALRRQGVRRLHRLRRRLRRQVQGSGPGHVSPVRARQWDLTARSTLLTTRPAASGA